ncbi:MAG: zinc metallopeptidase [Nitrospira sp. CG24B]|nr:MAG: zinc metallopeptidase [Nitrospira sp. CG24B]
MAGIILLVIIVGLVILGPQFWTKRVFAKHSAPRPDYPGTGAELARHLLNRFDMQHITVELTETGDHYDPVSKAVRLTPAIFEGKSLTAITIVEPYEAYRKPTSPPPCFPFKATNRWGTSWNEGIDSNA